MSEEFQGDNQITEGQQLETNTPQETNIQQPSSPQESQYFEIKYNKEPVKVSYDEAPTYIQKGMNYDKVHQQVETYQQQLDRVARVAGYNSHDEMLAELDAIEQQQERQRYENAGIDPDQFKELVSELPEIQQFREIQRQQEETQRFQQEANELFAEFPDLKPEQIPAEVWQLKESKGLSLLDSYLRVSYKSLGQQKEQEAIQKLQQNALSSPGSLGAGADHQATSIKDMSKGDFESMIQRVKRGERVEL